MDVLTILSIVWRHWIVVGVVLALTAIPATVIIAADEPTYQMRGSYLVTTPDVAAADAWSHDTTSPVLTDLSAPIVAEAVQSGRAHEQVRDEGGDADYTVTGEQGLLRIRATSSDRDAVVPTVTAVIDAVESEIADIQEDAGAPEDQRATVQVISAPTDASVQKQTVGDDDTYSAQGSVRIAAVPDAIGVNPYQESPAFTMRVLEEVMTGESARARIRDAGGRGTYVFEQPLDDADRVAAPVTYLTATANSPAGAEATHEAALTVARDELARRQETLGALGASQVGLYPLSVQSAANELPSDLIRTLIAIAGVGLVAAVGTALSWDHVQQAMRRRRKEAGQVLSQARSGNDQRAPGALGATTAQDGVPSRSPFQDDPDAPATTAANPEATDPISKAVLATPGKELARRQEAWSSLATYIVRRYPFSVQGPAQPAHLTWVILSATEAARPLSQERPGNGQRAPSALGATTTQDHKGGMPSRSPFQDDPDAPATTAANPEATDPISKAVLATPGKELARRQEAWSSLATFIVRRYPFPVQGPAQPVDLARVILSATEATQPLPTQPRNGRQSIHNNGAIPTPTNGSPCEPVPQPPAEDGAARATTADNGTDHISEPVPGATGQELARLQDAWGSLGAFTVPPTRD